MKNMFFLILIVKISSAYCQGWSVNAGTLFTYTEDKKNVKQESTSTFSPGIRAEFSRFAVGEDVSVALPYILSIGADYSFSKGEKAYLGYRHFKAKTRVLQMSVRALAQTRNFNDNFYFLMGIEGGYAHFVDEIEMKESDIQFFKQEFKEFDPTARTMTKKTPFLGFLFGGIINFGSMKLFPLVGYRLVAPADSGYFLNISTGIQEENAFFSLQVVIPVFKED